MSDPPMLHAMCIPLSGNQQHCGFVGHSLVFSLLCSSGCPADQKQHVIGSSILDEAFTIEFLIFLMEQ